MNMRRSMSAETYVVEGSGEDAVMRAERLVTYG